MSADGSTNQETLDDAIVQAAVDIVARDVISLREHNFEDNDTWEEYPDIDFYEWRRVVKRVLEIVSELRPDPQQLQEAYQCLKERANQANQG